MLARVQGWFENYSRWRGPRRRVSSSSTKLTPWAGPGTIEIKGLKARKKIDRERGREEANREILVFSMC